MNRQRKSLIALLLAMLVLGLLTGCGGNKATTGPSGTTGQAQTTDAVAPQQGTPGEQPATTGQPPAGAPDASVSNGVPQSGAGAAAPNNPAAGGQSTGGLVKSSSKLSDPQAEAALEQLDSQLQQLEQQLDQMDDVLDEDTTF